MSGCAGCKGSCGGCCGSCGSCGVMELAAEEIALLVQLGQIPFLPVARRVDDMEPFCFEQPEYPPERCSLALQCLEKRGLVSIDYDKPLPGAYGPAYDPYPVKGSFALTARGQQVVELLDIQGIE